MAEETLFTKIIKGEIPSHKVYEGDKVFAFLDIHPKQPGHTLVVPKNPVQFVWDLPDEDYTALMAAVKQIGQKLREVMGKPYVGEQIMGTDVPHTHVHLFPFATPEEFYTHPDMEAEPDHQALAEIARKLAF